jgi:serine protease Do
MLKRIRLFLQVFLMVVVLMAGFESRAQVKATATPDGTIDAAIAAVYPSLVQIYVLTVSPMEGRERKFQASGSGAIIAPEGLVITNHHVAGKAVAIRCVLSTKEEVEATLVGTDALTDISVLKLDLSSRPKNAPPLVVSRFGSSASLKVGDTVFAMGCPLAISQSVTKGIVSNTNMIFPKMLNIGFTLDGEDVGSIVKWIGHDASIFPGNSGGPLVNLKGEIVGINEIGFGLAGAIPSDLASAIAKELIASGSIRRAWIGAAFQPLLKAETHDANPQGVLVSSVLAGSPADKAGLQPGDVLEAINGAPVLVRFQEELPAFIRVIVSLPIGKPVELLASRGGKEVKLSMQPENRDEAKGKESEFKEWGMTARRLTRMEAKEMRRPDRRGVLVGTVRQGGPVNMALPALRPYDVIVEVAGQAVDDVDALRKVTAEITKDQAEPVTALVGFERNAERQLSVVEVGIRSEQEQPAEAKKAWLPVSTQVLSKKLASALNLKGKKGVRLTQVYPESAAQAAGFKVGDIITHVDDQLVDASEPHDSEVFESMLWAYKPGAQAEFTVIRNGQPLKIAAKLGEAPKAERELRVYDDLAFEFKARDLSYLDRVKGQMELNQNGAVAGLRTDDLIQAVDNQPVGDVKTLEAVLKSLRAKKPPQVVFFVKRGIYTQFIEIEPTWPDKL